MSRPQKAGDSPFGLRLLHALFFLAIVVPVAIATSWLELSQLFAAVTSKYVCGSPPLPLPIFGALCGAVCAALLLFFFVKGKSAPLWVSLVGLAGAACSVVGMHAAEARRSCIGANVDVLAAARQLHQLQVDRLQRTGFMPGNEVLWQEALSGLKLPPPQFRTRTLQQLPWKLVRTEEPNASAAGLAPGTLMVWVSKDGVTFEIKPVGVIQGDAAVLVDDEKAPIILKGTFNPEVPGAGAEAGR